jgi:hypothetical protein
MRRFPLIAVALLLVPLAGCGEESSIETKDAGTIYFESAQALLDAPARMAQFVTAPLRRPPGPWPSQAQIDEVLEDAVAARDALRDVPLDDPRLRDQRDRLIETYASVLIQMRDVGRDLSRQDRGGLRAKSARFFAVLRDLGASA